MPSPAVTVNGSSTTNGVNVASGAVVTIQLIDLTATAWAITCTGTDDTNTTAAIQASLVVNQNTKTATFTIPSRTGQAIVFQSVVNNGRDANGNIVASYTTTFAVFVLTVSGVRVLATNESQESSAAYGWIVDINPTLRTAPGGPITLAGDVNGSSVANTVFQATGTGGFFTILCSGEQWGSAVTAPTISQAIVPGGSGTPANGQTFSTYAQAGQAGTGTANNANGGDWIVGSGAPGTGGSGTAGSSGAIRLRIGGPTGTDRMVLTNTAVAFSALSSNGYVSTTGGTGTLSVSATIPSSAITGTFTLTGDVTGNTGATIVSGLGNGLTTIAYHATTGITADVGAAWTLSQTAPGSDLATIDLTFRPQRAFATGTHASGNFTVDLGAVGSGGTVEARLLVEHTASFVLGFSAYDTAPNTYAGVWAGPGITPNISNFLFLTDGATIAYFNNVSATGTLALSFAGNIASAGSINLSGNTGILAWAKATTTPTLKVSDQTAASTNGVATTIQSQNATGTSSTGGALNLTSGTGTTVAGNTYLQCGGVTVLAISPTAATLSQPLLRASGVAPAQGYAAIAMPDANHTLTGPEIASSIHRITGTLTATRNMVVPLTNGALWFAHNLTGQGIQYIGATGTGVTVPSGALYKVYSDGTNVYGTT